MDSSSNEMFKALHMLAEVASSKLQNEQSVFLNVPFQEAENFKIQRSTIQKEAKNSEQLTLREIKDLSGNNLVEMFSVREVVICSKKKKFCFKCVFFPEICSRIFKSCASEKGAKYKIKAHLFSHIKELAEKEGWFSVLHDHYYTSVNGRTSAGETTFKLYLDPFQTVENSPLTIPTLPFPFVYVPMYPHSSVIQEIPFNAS